MRSVLPMDLAITPVSNRTPVTAEDRSPSAGSDYGSATRRKQLLLAVDRGAQKKGGGRDNHLPDCRTNISGKTNFINEQGTLKYLPELGGIGSGGFRGQPGWVLF